MPKSDSGTDKSAPAFAKIGEDETSAMLRAYFNLSKRLTLSDQKGRILLGSPDVRTYARWKAGRPNHPGFRATRVNAYPS